MSDDPNKWPDSFEFKTPEEADCTAKFIVKQLKEAYAAGYREAIEKAANAIHKARASCSARGPLDMALFNLAESIRSLPLPKKSETPR